MEVDDEFQELPGLQGSQDPQETQETQETQESQESQMSECAMRDISSQEDRHRSAELMRTSSAESEAQFAGRENPDGEPSNKTVIPLQILRDRPPAMMLDGDALTPCKSIRPDNVLIILNEYLGTTYTLEELPDFESVWDKFGENGYDVGYAYGHLRHIWGPCVARTFWRSSKAEEINDARMRYQAIDGNKIRRPETPPRRIWDLYSNRVLPWWMVQPDMDRIYPVSHSWVASASLEYFETPINRKRWVVPIPQGPTGETNTTLDRVRNELINFGAEYAWLDVLCLRQFLPRVPPTKKQSDELSIDVPTIGYVYQGREHIVTYFSGLGCPYTSMDPDNERSWIKRAWTLQETNANPHIGGYTGAHAAPTLQTVGASANQRHQDIFDVASGVVHMMNKDYDVFSLIAHMRERYATTDTDKIAGMAYLLKSKVVPVYRKDEDPEVAWAQLVECMADKYREQLISLWPGPRKDSEHWIPSWKEVMDTNIKLPRPEVPALSDPPSEWSASSRSCTLVPKSNEVMKSWEWSGTAIRSCKIRCLGGPVKKGSKHRQGYIRVRPRGSAANRTVFVDAHHDIVINPNVRYTLLGAPGSRFWVVCKKPPPTEPSNGPQETKKITVIRISKTRQEVKVAQKKLSGACSRNVKYTIR